MSILIRGKVLRHSEEAKEKKLLAENLRLAPRERIAIALHDAITKQLAQRQHRNNGVRNTPEDVAKFAEQQAKAAVERFDLEPVVSKRDV